MPWPNGGIVSVQFIPQVGIIPFPGKIQIFLLPGQQISPVQILRKRVPLNHVIITKLRPLKAVPWDITLEPPGGAVRQRGNIGKRRLIMQKLIHVEKAAQQLFVDVGAIAVDGFRACRSTSAPFLRQEYGLLLQPVIARYRVQLGEGAQLLAESGSAVSIPAHQALPRSVQAGCFSENMQQGIIWNRQVGFYGFPSLALPQAIL